MGMGYVQLEELQGETFRLEKMARDLDIEARVSNELRE